MTTENNQNPTATETDEIDLFDLMDILLKGKAVVLITTLIFLAAGALYFFLAPQQEPLFVTQARIQVGLAAGHPLESRAALTDYLASDAFLKELPQGEDITFSVDDKDKASPVITLEARSATPGEYDDQMAQAIAFFTQRYAHLYEQAQNHINKALSESSDGSDTIPSLEYVLDSYNYPHRVLKEPAEPHLEDRGILKKMIIVAFAGLFMGVFMVFFLEFLTAYRKHRENL